MFITTLQKIARASVGVLAAGILVGLATPASATTPVATAAGATPMSANLATAPSFTAKGRPLRTKRKLAVAGRPSV